MKSTDSHLKTVVSDMDFQGSYKDEYGVVYSKDGSKLLYAQSFGRKPSKKKYLIKPGTKIICDRAFSCWPTSIEIPDSVTHIGNHAFDYCSKVNFDLPESIIYIGDGAFETCVFLNGNFVIPSSVSEIAGNPLPSCIESVECRSPHFKVVNNCLYSQDMKLLIAVIKDVEKNITLPNTVVKIGDSAFKGTKKLETVIIPDSVLQIGNNAFEGNYLKELIIPPSVNQIGENIFGVSCPKTLICESPHFVLEDKTLYTKDKTKIIFCRNSHDSSFLIPDTVTHIESFSFYYSSIKQITIPESVTHIGNHAFEGSSVKELVIPKSVQHIGRAAFCQCDFLSKFSLQKSIAEIDWEIVCERPSEFAFFACPSLNEIHIPDISDEVFSKLRIESPNITRC